MKVTKKAVKQNLETLLRFRKNHPHKGPLPKTARHSAPLKAGQAGAEITGPRKLVFRLEISERTQERIKSLGLEVGQYFPHLIKEDLKQFEVEEEAKGAELVWESRGMRCKLTRSVDGKGTLFFESGREQAHKVKYQESMMRFAVCDEYEFDGLDYGEAYHSWLRDIANEL